MANSKVVTFEEWQRDYGATDEEVAEVKKLIEMAERGEWPEGPTVHFGRPRELDEDAQVVTFRLSAAKAKAVDSKAAQMGKNRSDALREAVDEWLLRA